MPSPQLIILPPVGVLRRSHGNWQVPRRWLQGMRAYARCWPGQLSVFANAVDQEFHQGHLDAETVRELPFGVHVDAAPDDAATSISQSESVVLAHRGRSAIPYVHALFRAGVPVVLDLVKPPRVRRAIIRVESPNFLRRWRRYVYSWNTDRRFQGFIPRARALQCKGIPSQVAYGGQNADVLAYFDNRLATEDAATDADLQARARRLRDGARLELVYAGRMATIKGVTDLPDVMKAVRDLGIDAHLHVCGDGPQLAATRQKTERLGIGGHVTFHGALERRTGLYPLLRERADLFLCCHHQGDPSHVYLESMGCGVAPVGYANESLYGFEQQHGVGASVPMKDQAALAALVAQLAAQPEQVVRMAQAARRFADKHLFDKTWERRTAHLVSCLEPLRT